MRNSSIGLHADGTYVAKAGSYMGASYIVRFPDGTVYDAIRNEIGFTGRQWRLLLDGRYIAEDVASLKDCVELAKGDHSGRLLLEDAIRRYNSTKGNS